MIPFFRSRFRQRLLAQLDRLEQKADAILVNLAREENALMALIDDVAADVAAQTTVIDSAVTLLEGLSAQLAAAIASGDPAKVQAVKDSLDANTAKLAAAVVANTPAAP